MKQPISWKDKEELLVMNVTQNDKGVYVNEDPVVGMILLTRAT